MRVYVQAHAPGRTQVINNSALRMGGFLERGGSSNYITLSRLCLDQGGSEINVNELII